MRYLKTKDFGRVTAFELGWSPIGRPAMTVHFYIADGLCIDTGLHHMREAAVAAVNRLHIHRILLTHHHEDHSGNAARMKKLFNIPVFGHPMTMKKMKRPFKILPYQHYAWGSAQPLQMDTLPATVQSEHIELQPLHTPGHSKDHTVFFEENEGWLFAGDLFIAEKIKYFRADEKMQDQIDSLRKASQLDFECLFCGHNPQLKKGKQKLRKKLQFLEDLRGAVMQLHDKGMHQNEIVKAIGLKENYLLKAFCMGNLSMINMVRAVLAD